MRPRRLLIVAAALALVLAPSSASGAARSRDCTWGASSIQAQIVNGRVVESAAATTGCTS